MRQKDIKIILYWAEQSSQGNLLYRHDKPNKPTKERPLSFVLFESPLPIHLSFNRQQGPPLSSLSGDT